MPQCSTSLRHSSQEKRKILVNSVKEMYDYTNYHFRFEENYMDKINYPALKEHRRLHKNFDTKIYDYYNELLQGGFVLGSELISVLKNWLIDHILVEDKKFCLFLAKGLLRLAGRISILLTVQGAANRSS